MELKKALKRIYSQNQKIDDSFDLGLLLDYCSDKPINREYAILYWKINKLFNIYNIFDSLGIKDGYKHLDAKYNTLEFKIEKKDYSYILDSVAYLFDENIKVEIENSIKAKNVINANPNNKQVQICKVDKLDIKLSTSDLNLSNNPNLPLYPTFRGLNLIDGILFGDPNDDVVLNLTKEEIKEGYIDSSTGDITIDYINIKKLEISSSTGDVYIGSNVIIKDLIINTSTGDITINNANIANIDVNSSTGSISIKNKNANIINANSNIGDISIIAETKNIKCNTNGSIHIKNI